MSSRGLVFMTPITHTAAHGEGNALHRAQVATSAYFSNLPARAAPDSSSPPLCMQLAIRETQAFVRTGRSLTPEPSGCPSDPFSSHAAPHQPPSLGLWSEPGSVPTAPRRESMPFATLVFITTSKANFYSTGLQGHK